jgi:hypothetical protein
MQLAALHRGGGLTTDRVKRGGRWSEAGEQLKAEKKTMTIRKDDSSQMKTIRVRRCAPEMPQFAPRRGCTRYESSVDSSHSPMK